MCGVRANEGMCVYGGGGGCEDVSWIRSDVWYILCVDNYFTGTGQTSVLQECSQGPSTSLDPGGGGSYSIQGPPWTSARGGPAQQV